MLKPESIVRLWLPDFNLSVWITGIKTKIVSQDQQANPFEEMIFYIFIVVVLMVLIILALAFAKIDRFKVSIIKKTKDVKKKFVFNGMVRSMLISFLQMSMGCAAQFGLFMSDSDYISGTQMGTACLMLIYVNFLPVHTARFLSKRRDLLDTPEFKAKYENLYADVHLKRSDHNIYNLPFFLLKRIAFVFLPVLLIGMQGL